MLVVLDKNDLARWFGRRLNLLRVRRDTRAYVAGVFAGYRTEDVDEQSVTLAFKCAYESNSFQAYQRVGDWVLWCGTFCPERMDSFRQVFESYGRLSYDACYRILRRRWPLYEELADELPSIVDAARTAF